MNREPNAVCQTCGRPYYRCLSCDELERKGIVSWRGNCDTPECFAIFMTALDVRDGKITDKQALKDLEKYDLQPMLNSNSGVKRILYPIIQQQESAVQNIADSKPIIAKVKNKKHN